MRQLEASADDKHEAAMSTLMVQQSAFQTQSGRQLISLFNDKGVAGAFVAACSSQGHRLGGGRL